MRQTIFTVIVANFTIKCNIVSRHAQRRRPDVPLHVLPAAHQPLHVQLLSVRGTSAQVTTYICLLFDERKGLDKQLNLVLS